jgi:hypothetical protein
MMVNTVGFWLIFLVGLAPLVLVPLLIRLAPVPAQAQKLLWGALLPLLLALLLEQGFLTGLLCLPYLLACLGLVFLGLQRLASCWHRPGEIPLGLGLLYLPVGAVWLAASRMGLEFLGYPPLLVLLTAAHFHYAGFTAATLAGFLCRLFPEDRLLSRAALVVAMGPPLVALGIQFSPVVEVISAIILASGMLGLVVGSVGNLGSLKKPAAILLGLALLGLVPTMGLAMTFAVGELLERVFVDILTMLLWHGTTNALLFGLCGSIAMWGLRERLVPVVELPASIYRGSGAIGLDYFERVGAVEKGRAEPVGMVDCLEELQHPGFDPGKVSLEVRHFYEHTVDWRFYVKAHWQVLAFSRLVRFFTARFQQIQLPLDVRDVEGWQEVACRFAWLQGCSGARTSVRWYTENREPLYVAAYSSPRLGEYGYMDIALPLPFSQLAVTLRMDNVGEGILLTASGAGAEGIRIRTRFLTVRLPMTEELMLGVESPGVLMAVHRFGILGLPIVTLNYRLIRG